jgi:hypothetical protein
MLPLAEYVSNIKGVGTLSVRLVQHVEQNKLTVKPTKQTKTEMQCRPGYRTQQVLRHKQIPQYEIYHNEYGTHSRLTGYRSKSYTDTIQVYEPCHVKVPAVQVVPTTISKLEYTRSNHIEFSMKLTDYKVGMLNNQAYKILSITQTTPDERKTLKTPNISNHKP